MKQLHREQAALKALLLSKLAIDCGPVTTDQYSPRINPCDLDNASWNRFLCKANKNNGYMPWYDAIIGADSEEDQEIHGPETIIKIDGPNYEDGQTKGVLLEAHSFLDSYGLCTNFFLYWLNADRANKLVHAGRGAKVLLRQFFDFWERVLAESDFHAGCPVVAAAIGSADDEVRLSAEAARIFAHWRTALTWAFVADGFVESDADSLAVMSIATLEGAVVLCRSTRSSEPLHKVYEQLEFLVKARELTAAMDCRIAATD